MAEQYWEKYTDGNGIEWGTQLIDYDDVDNAGARGNLSVAIGKANLAYGEMSFAAGCRTKALGAASSSDGIHTVAGGKASHAGGYYTKTTNDTEFAVGRFNESTSDQTIFSVGNGEDEEARSNALEVTLDDKTIVKKLQVLNPGDTTAVAGLGLDEDNNVVLIEGSTSGVNDGKFTITAAGTTISEFTANQEGDTTLDISTDDTLTLTQTQSGIQLGVKYYQQIQPLTIQANGYDVLEYNPIQSETASSLNVVQGEGIQLTYDEGVITISAHQNTPNTPNDGKLFVQAGGVLNQVFTANQSGSTTLSIVGSGGTTVSQSGNTLTISTDEVSEVNDGKLQVLLNNSVIKEFSANQSENTVLQIEIPGLYIDQDGTLKSNIESANNSKIQVYYDDQLYTELYLNSPYNQSLNLPKIQDAEIQVTAQNRILGSFSLNQEEDATIDLSELLPTGVGSPFEEVNGNVRRINSDEPVQGDNNISFSTYKGQDTTSVLPVTVLLDTEINYENAYIGDSLSYTYNGDTFISKIVDKDDISVTLESPLITDSDIYNAIASEYSTINLTVNKQNYLDGEQSILFGENNKLYTGETSLIGGQDNVVHESFRSIISGSSNAVGHSGSESDTYIEDSILTGHNNSICGSVNSIVSGYNNKSKSSAENNIIAGESNAIQDTWNSLIIGSSNKTDANVEETIVSGTKNIIHGGENNIIVGDNNVTSDIDDSIIAGSYNSAIANPSAEGLLLVGDHLTASKNYESALGQYNQSSNNTAFSIGTGTGATQRKNAFEVTTDDITIIRKGKILEPLQTSAVDYLGLDSQHNIVSILKLFAYQSETIDNSTAVGEIDYVFDFGDKDVLYVDLTLTNPGIDGYDVALISKLNIENGPKPGCSKEYNLYIRSKNAVQTGSHADIKLKGFLKELKDELYNDGIIPGDFIRVAFRVFNFGNPALYSGHDQYEIVYEYVECNPAVSKVSGPPFNNDVVTIQ